MQDECTEINRGHGTELRQGSGERQRGGAHSLHWPQTQAVSDGLPTGQLQQPKYGGEGKRWAGSKSVGFPEPNPPLRTPTWNVQMLRSCGAVPEPTETLYFLRRTRELHQHNSQQLPVGDPGARHSPRKFKKISRVLHFKISMTAGPTGHLILIKTPPQKTLFPLKQTLLSLSDPSCLPTTRIICP